MKSERVYACTIPGVPQVVVISKGFEHVPPTRLAAFIVAAIAPALDDFYGLPFVGAPSPQRFPRRVNGGGDLLIECDTDEAASRLRMRIDDLNPVATVKKLVTALEKNP